MLTVKNLNFNWPIFSACCLWASHRQEPLPASAAVHTVAGGPLGEGGQESTFHEVAGEFFEHLLTKSSITIRCFSFQVRLFYDFTPSGSLCHILSALFKYKSDQGWRRFDLGSPSRKDANLQMCLKVEEALIEQNLHKVPIVYVKENLRDKDKDKVRDLVLLAKGGTWKNWKWAYEPTFLFCAQYYESAFWIWFHQNKFVSVILLQPSS